MYHASSKSIHGVKSLRMKEAACFGQSSMIQTAGKGLGTSVKVSSNESGKGLGCFSFLLPDEDRCILYE